MIMKTVFEIKNSAGVAVIDCINMTFRWKDWSSSYPLFQNNGKWYIQYCDHQILMDSKNSEMIEEAFEKFMNQFDDVDKLMLEMGYPVSGIQYISIQSVLHELNQQ